MKTKRFLLLGLLVIGTLGACQNKEAIRPEWFKQGWGDVSALQNGTPWSNTGATALYVKKEGVIPCPERFVGLVFFQFSRDGYNRQLLDFSYIRRATGEYRLTDNVASNCNSLHISTLFSTLQDDGDVGKSVYSLDTTAQNYLRITAYDSIRNEIRGTFKVSFIKRAKYVNDDPARVTFEQGEFWTKIAEKGRFE